MTVALTLKSRTPTDENLEYALKVRSLDPDNLLGYWPMWEASGTTSVNFEGTSARDGTYSNVTLAQTGIGDGNTCPSWNGTTSYTDMYSTSLRDAFDGGEGTLSCWLKVSGSGVWTDSAIRHVISLYADDNNRVVLFKRGAANGFSFWYYAGGTAETRNKASITTTDWAHVGITWSATADTVQPYWGGVAEGAAMTGLGTWAGNLDSDETAIGARTISSPTQVWDGYLAHFVLWKTPFSAAQMALLTTVDSGSGDAGLTLQSRSLALTLKDDPR